MTSQLKAKWVAALRSGDFTQGFGYLNRGNKQFCCLGVLCEVAGVRKELQSTHPSARGDDVPYGYWLEDKLGTLLRLGQVGGAFGQLDDNHLLHLNDSRAWSFEKIAEWIETNVTTDD